MNRTSLLIALIVPSLFLACGAGENTVGTDWSPDAGAPGDANGDACSSCTSGSAKLLVSIPEACLSAPVGERSAPQSYEISNQGTGPSGALKVNLIGFNAASFVITSDTCTGTALAVGTLCKVTVAYAPAAAHENAEVATLIVSDDQTDINALVFGSDIGKVVVSPAALDFGTLEAGSTSDELVVQVTTTSYCGPTWTATIDNPKFVITSNTCTHRSTSPCQIGVRLAPPEGPNPTTVVGLLTVSAGDSGSATVSLSGIISPIHPTPSPLTASPAVFDFGDVPVGQSAIGTITVSGAGAVPTALIAGSGATWFSIFANTCTAAGETCTIQVKFAPTIPGASSATLSIHDGQSMVTVSLQGNALAVSVASSFTVAPAAVDFGQISVTKTSDPLTITVTGPSARSLNLSLSDSVASQMAIVGDTCTGAVIPASGTCTISIAFKPTKIGKAASTLNISDGTDVVAVYLAGEGGTLL